MANGQTDTAGLMPTIQDLSSLLSPQQSTQPPQQQQPVQQTQPQPEVAKPTTDQGTGAPSFELPASNPEKEPLAWGLRVGTPDDVKKFDAYAIQHNGDVSAIPIQDQLGIALAKDPQFFKKNPDVFYEHVYRPLQAQAQSQSAGDIFNQAVAALPGAIGTFFSNAGQGISNQVNLAKDFAELNFRKATGMTGDQGYQELTNRLAVEGATNAQGLAKAITDTHNLAFETFNGMIQGTKPIAKLFTQDPASQDQIERAYSQILLNKASGEQELADLGNQFQNFAAQAYRASGAYADVGQKMLTATPNEAAVAGIATLASPLNFAGIGEGELVVGAARPIMFERGMEAMEDLAAAKAGKAALDVTQILPQAPELNAADPAYIAARNLQASLAPEARNAAQDVANAQSTLNSRLTTIGQIAGDPSAVTTFAANVLQATGTGLQTAGTVARAITDMPETFANWLSMGNEPIKKAIQSGIEKTIFGGVLHHWGPVGVAIESGLEHLPDIADSVASLPKTMGKELLYADNTVPYWTRVAQQEKMLPKGLASFLDSPLVQSATNIAQAGVSGAATGAAIGGLAGGIPGAVGGAMQGGLLGMAGGGFGQWQRFQNPNQYLLAARSDWKRYRDLLSPTEQQSFSQLSPTNQVIVAQSASHFPGLRIDYFNDPNGPRGMHYVDQGGASHIQVNTANPDSAIAGIAAHELTHATTHSGMLPELYDTLLGNPQTGEKGQFTALDPTGNPVGVDPITGRYKTNQDFQNLKNQYVNALAQSGVPTSHLGDFDIAKEIYAEHGVDYLLSGGAVQDSNSAFRAGLYSKNALKTALAKIGYTFDESGRMIGAPGGDVSGTGLFSSLQRNPTLGKLAQAYHTKQWQEGLINSEEQPTQRFTKRDMQNPNVAESKLTNAAEIVRNQDGTAARDPLTGEPIYRTPKEVKEYNANFAQALRKGLESLPEDQRMDLGMRSTPEGNTFTRYLPDNLLDSLASTNQYNPHQIASLRMLSRVLADGGNPGMEMRFFYHKALSAGKRYGSFEGTEKIAVPYGFEITGDNNVNIKSVDFNQLNANYLRMRNREPFKSLWQSPSEFTQDAHTYFTNHKDGQPGATAIGEQKRDAINSLSNFGTQLQRESNPLASAIPQSVRPIIKSYRIDRANQISATGAVRPFISEEQYYKMNRNYLPSAPGAPEISYLPRRAAAPAPEERVPGAPAPDALAAAKAVPKEQRTNAHWETINQDRVARWNAQPETVPMEAKRDENGNLIVQGGQIQYKQQDYGLLTSPPIQKIFAKFGDNAKGWNKAVDYLSNRLVKEYQGWLHIPELQDAMGWYSGMRDRSQSVLGANIDQMGNTLAASSPQTGVVQNFRYTLEALKKLSTGDYNDLMDRFQDHINASIDKIDQDTRVAERMRRAKTPERADAICTETIRKEINKFEDQPLRDNGKKYGFNSTRVLHALADIWADQAGGPKTGNFGRNLTFRSFLPTIDMWAGRTSRRLLYEGQPSQERWRLSSEQESGVGDGRDYRFAEAAFQRAADKLGLKGDDYQAFMWYGEKNHWNDRGWTSGAGSELSDFRKTFDEALGGAQRHQLGVTTFRTPETFDPADLERARAQIQGHIESIPGVAASRVTTSQGMYGGYIEPTIDAEFTAAQGADLSRLHAAVRDISQRSGQEASFVTRVHNDLDAPGARPIFEVGFHRPASEDQLQQLMTQFSDHGLGGFTVARNRQGKALGIRSQSIPEFDSSVAPSNHQEYHENWRNTANVLSTKLERDPNITYRKIRAANTQIYRKGQDY